MTRHLLCSFPQKVEAGLQKGLLSPVPVVWGKLPTLPAPGHLTPGPRRCQWLPELAQCTSHLKKDK